MYSSNAPTFAYYIRLLILFRGTDLIRNISLIKY